MTLYKDIVAGTLLAGLLAGPLAYAADADTDTVDDSVDACLGTSVPESVPTTGSLAPHRYALVTLPTFDNNDNNVVTPDFTITDTGGCSCEQILANVGAGPTDSQIRRGCTLETMLDWVAPTTTVTIDSITDDTATPGDFITSDDDGLTIAATLSAALAAGEILEYSNDNGATFTDITGSVSGTAVSHVDAGLTSTDTIQMRVTNTFGNSGATATQLVTIDTTAPTTTVTIDSITNDTGTPSDFITSDDDGLTIGATLSAALAAGEILEYSNDNGATFTDISGSVAGTAVTHVDATLTSTDTIRMRVSDTAGNNGAAASQLVTIDTVAPTTTVTIDSITVDTGTPGDFITSDNDGLTIGATLSAALAAGEILEYSNDNGVTFTDISGSVAGTAVTHVDASLTGTNTIQMRVSDGANNGPAATQPVTIDTTAPTTTVTIDSITDDTGTPGDFITNDNDGLTIGATLSVALAAGEKLEYSNDNGATFTDITTSVTGTAVSHVDAALTSTNTIQMRVSDGANNGATASQLVTIDTTAPTTTVTIDSITVDTGTPGDFITNDNDGLTIGATLSAGLAAGEKLEYSNDNGVTFTDISGSVAGTTVTHADASLTSTNTIKMRVTNTIGNSGATASQLVTIDTVAPTTTVTIDSITDDSGTPGDFITNDNDGLTIGATLSVALAAGEKLEYSNNNGATFTDITGSVSGTAVTHVDVSLTGTNTIKMRVSDGANNGATASQLVTIDTVAPTTTVTIDSITDDTGTPGDFITNDNDGLTIGATLSVALAAGEKLEYSNDNGATFTDITASVTGTTVSHVDAALTSSDTMQMRVSDGANNGPAASQSVTIDTMAPTTTVTIDSITVDTGPADFITADNDGLTIGATLSAGLAAGEKLEYSNDNGVTFTDISGSVAGTAVTHIDASLTSTNTIQMRVSDGANNGPTASQLVTIVPNTAPTATNDSYNDLPVNVLLDAGAVTASGVEVNDADGVLTKGTDDSDPETDPLTVTKVQATVVPGGGSATATTSGGGTVTMNSDGTFTYVSEVGETAATDTFTYEISDGALTDTATVTITFTANTIWFIDSGGAAVATGQSDDPFDDIAAFNGATTGTTDLIFLHTGTYTDDGIDLLASQQLIGAEDGLTDGNLSIATGTAPTLAPAADNGINLASGNTVRGLNIGNTPGTSSAFVGTGVGTLTVSNVEVSGTGGIIDITTGALAVTFDSLESTSSSGGPGIDLSGVTGSFSVTDGSGTDTTISGAASGISIQGSTGGATFSFGDTSVSSSGDGIDLGTTTGNAGGATFTFESLSVTTTAGDGFLADDSGTVNIGDTTSTISATGGIGLSLTSTDIGGGGMTFASLASSGGNYGIQIVDAAGNATFTTVAIASTVQGVPQTFSPFSGSNTRETPNENGNGDGIYLQDNTGTFTVNGGTITSSADNAIDIFDAGGIMVSNVTIDGTANTAVQATRVAGLSIIDTMIKNFGNATAVSTARENGISLREVTGAITLQRSTIDTGFGFVFERFAQLPENIGLEINNISAAAATLTVTGSTFKNIDFEGIQARHIDGNLTLTVDGGTGDGANTFEKINGAAINFGQTAADSGGSDGVFYLGDTNLTDVGLGARVGLINTSDVDLTLVDNVVTRTFSDGFRIRGFGGATSSDLVGRITGNLLDDIGLAVSTVGGAGQLGAGNGIEMLMENRTNSIVLIDDNIIDDVIDNGGSIGVNVANNSLSDMDLVFTNNIVRGITSNGSGPEPETDFNLISADDTVGAATTCIALTGNDMTPTSPAGAAGVTYDFRFDIAPASGTSSVTLEDYSTPAADTCSGFGLPPNAELFLKTNNTTDQICASIEAFGVNLIAVDPAPGGADLCMRPPP